ncbi:MAG: portal protein [Pseudaminobacter sp.]
MGIVDDLLQLQSRLAYERAQWEDAWLDCVNLAMPYASHRYDFSGASTISSLTGTAREPAAARRSKELYDGEAVWASERLAGGVESTVSPRSQKWQDFILDGPFAPDPTDLEEEWLDKVRNYHFSVRYDARCNFVLANQKSIRSAVTLGTGILYSEENLGRKGIDPVTVPFFYRFVPVIEAYLGIDAYDDVDRCVRLTEMTASGAAAYFGAENISQKVRDAANDVKRSQETFTFMHAVLPREEAGDFKTKRAGMAFASFWAEVETRHLIRDSGFFTFPYQVMWWDQVDNSPYGQSPIMSILGDVKMLQAMSKSALQAAQQMVKPPLATMAGLYNQRLNLNPGAVNPGYIDDQGRQKAQPIITNQNPTFAENLMELKRQGIRRSTYVDLFQTLVQNPQMTATEAIIRANEKGELLGPAGAKIEAAHSKCTERELDIVGRKGAFNDGSPLVPPFSADGKNVGVRSTGPLARLRRMQELQGVESVMGLAGMFAQYDPNVAADVLDRIDHDETLEIAREIKGAPRKMFRTDAEVAERRAARAQQQEAAAAAQVTDMLAGAAGKATPAIKAAVDANKVAA